MSATMAPPLAADDAAVGPAREQTEPDPALMPLLHILARIAQRCAAAAETPPDAHGKGVKKVAAVPRAATKEFAATGTAPDVNGGDVCVQL